jgi:uncharacterized protein (DUF433 family)
MTNVEKVRASVSALSREEKAAVLEWIAREIAGAFPGISIDPGVAGGEPCIVRTRIPVWALVRARELGASEATLLQSYPTLRAEDLVHAWNYDGLHHEEIERQIQDNEAA